MRYIVVCLTCQFYLVASSAAPAGQSSPPPKREVASSAATRMRTPQKREQGPVGLPENRWRYSFRNGHWWYYRDGGRWDYWTGKQWRQYEPESYRRWYVARKIADYNRELARFDAQTMGPYVARGFSNRSSGVGALYYGAARPFLGSPSTGGTTSGLDLFQPRPFDGRLNIGTSTGGYMGGALRGTFGD